MPKRKTGPKPRPDAVRGCTTGVRSGRPWKAFLGDLAASSGAATVADVIERAVAAYSTSFTLGPPPPR